MINHTPADLRGKMLATVIASFDGQHRGDARCTIFVYSLRLACRVVVNLYTVLVGIATDRLHHPSGSVTFDTSHALPLDVDTLLFASGNALVQFSPMLIIPLGAINDAAVGASQGLLPRCSSAGAGGVSVYQNDRRINLSCFCFEFGDRVDLVFILSLLIPVMGYPHPALFITLFLGAAYSRLVSSSAVTIQFPDNKQRAGFSSLQTSMMYLMTTAAFFLSAFCYPTIAWRYKIWIRCWRYAITASGTPIIVIVLQRNWLNVRSSPIVSPLSSTHGLLIFKAKTGAYAPA